MTITPLQWLLLTKAVPLLSVRLVTGKSRGTVWRWAVGRSYPERHDAEKLIELYGVTRLDFNGCYEASRTITDDEAQAFGLVPRPLPQAEPAE